MGFMREVWSRLDIDRERAIGMVALGGCGLYAGFLLSRLNEKFATAMVIYFTGNSTPAQTFWVYPLTYTFCVAVGVGLAYFVRPAEVDPSMLPLDAINADEKRTGM